MEVALEVVAVEVSHQEVAGETVGVSAEGEEEIAAGSEEAEAVDFPQEVAAATEEDFEEGVVETVEGVLEAEGGVQGGGAPLEGAGEVSVVGRKSSLSLTGMKVCS